MLDSKRKTSPEDLKYKFEVMFARLHLLAPFKGGLFCYQCIPSVTLIKKLDEDILLKIVRRTVRIHIANISPYAV